ncbi:MAG: Lipoprotein [Frankiales bacterium]|nr:Lipoprotein [Frankiales bacterium]
MGVRSFRLLYGSSVLHVLAVAGCLALAGAAVVAVADGSSALRIGAWFLGAVLLHDLVLFPLYAAADRVASSVLPRGSVNWVRVPTLLSGLLLLVFWPVITQHSEESFRFASSRDQDVYLTRYLVLVAALFLGSALLYGVTRLRRRRA